MAKKYTRKDLKRAREELERVGRRDKRESKAFLRANNKVIRIERALPWWKR